MSNQFHAPSPPASLEKVLELPGVSLLTKSQIKSYDDAREEEDRLNKQIIKLSPSRTRNRRKEILAEISNGKIALRDARKELDELERAPEIYKALKEKSKVMDFETSLPLAIEILEKVLSHVRPAADLFIDEERERYAEFGFEHLDSPLALGVEEAVKRQETALEGLKGRLKASRGGRGASLQVVSGAVELVRLSGKI